MECNTQYIAKRYQGTLLLYEHHFHHICYMCLLKDNAGVSEHLRKLHISTSKGSLQVNAKMGRSEDLHKVTWNILKSTADYDKMQIIRNMGERTWKGGESYEGVNVYKEIVETSIMSRWEMGALGDNKKHYKTLIYFLT